VTRGPGPSLCLSLSWEPTVTTAVLACPEVDDRSFVSAVNTPYLDQFIPANHLKKGERLKTPDGSLAVADGGSTPKDHDGWMWDLTVPGNNDHDFYVQPVDGNGGEAYPGARSTPILVHNDSCPTISKQDIQGLYDQARALYGARGVEDSTAAVARVWNRATQQAETWAATEDPLLPAAIKDNMGDAIYKFGDGHAEDTIVNSLGDEHTLLGIASSSRICDSCYGALRGVPGMIETRVGQSVPGIGVTQWRTMVNQGYVGS
jgi:hypothetical protein